MLSPLPSEEFVPTMPYPHEYERYIEERYLKGNNNVLEGDIDNDLSSSSKGSKGSGKKRSKRRGRHALRFQ